MRLVRGERQHDEVGVQAIHAVVRVGVPVGARPHLAHVRHRLVLALTRHVGVGEDDLGGQGGGIGGGQRGGGREGLWVCGLEMEGMLGVRRGTLESEKMTWGGAGGSGWGGSGFRE